jgi:NAD-dependent DNA ligase
MTEIDRHGQPIARGFNASRRTERDISEMLGLAKGVLADGEVSSGEAALLNDWMRTHPDVVSTWPGDILARRLSHIFADGRVEEAEREDLAELLRDLVGGVAGILASDNASTTLPLDEPQPDVSFPGQIFVLTGKFAMGPRAACQDIVMRVGGACESSVTQRTTYLVIGTFGSRDWIHTSHGRKIEKAVEYRRKGTGIAIIGEDHWARHLPAGSA